MIHWWAILLTACLLGVAPGKPMKGDWYADSGLTGIEPGQTCAVDSAAGAVLYISQEHENSLFPSKVENRVHLQLWFKDGLPERRVQLPSPSVAVCYWEKGDLLMFHTYSGAGWIEFDPAKSKSVTGRMELKLVQPHHNMSNSDYHYMGGDFKLNIRQR